MIILFIWLYIVETQQKKKHIIEIFYFSTIVLQIHLENKAVFNPICNTAKRTHHNHIFICVIVLEICSENKAIFNPICNTAKRTYFYSCNSVEKLSFFHTKLLSLQKNQSIYEYIQCLYVWLQKNSL